MSKCGEHVELGERDFGEAVDPHRVAQRDPVEPAAAATAPGDGAELAADLDHALADLVVELGGERAAADPGDVRLGDTDDRSIAFGPIPDAGARTARRRVRRGHERVGAVVDVEQRALGTFEEDVLAVLERLPDQQRGVGDVIVECVGVARGTPRRSGSASIGELVVDLGEDACSCP